MADDTTLTPTPGGTVVAIVGADPTTLNPTISTGPAELTLGCMVHEGLVEIRADGEYTPALAKSWTISEDNRTYTFELEEANWHDGEPFTAKDVAFFLSDVAPNVPLISAQISNRLDTVEVLGDHSISITLTEPYAPFLRMFACISGGAMLPAHLYAGTTPIESPVSRAPVGTGPFKFVEWIPGDSVRVTKNEDYWREGFPYLDGVVMRTMPSSASRIQALRSGDGDFIARYYVPTSEYAQIRADASMKLEPSSSPPNLLFAPFNINAEPFDDASVRRALFSVVDRNFIHQAVFAGNGQPATAPFGKIVEWSASPDIDYDTMYPADVEAANAALDAAGLPRDADGIRFSTNVSFSNATTEMLSAATAIQAAWRPLGVEVELRPLENSVLQQRVYTDADFGVALSLFTTFGDPALGLARVWVTPSIGRAYGNASRYSNPVVDDLFTQAVSLPSFEERGEIYAEVQHILAEDMPTMTLFETTNFDAAAARLHGLWGYEGNGRWWSGWLEQ